MARGSAQDSVQGGQLPIHRLRAPDDNPAEYKIWYAAVQATLDDVNEQAEDKNSEFDYFLVDREIYQMYRDWKERGDAGLDRS